MEMSESRRDLFSSSFGLDHVKKKLSTRLERKLAITITVLSAIVLILFIILVIKLSSNSQSSCTSEEEKNDCQSSEECIKLSMQIKSFLDPSIDPCDDFYSFSCNGWIDKNPIQPTGLEISKPWLSQRDINNQLKEILKNDTIRKLSPLSVQKVFRLYSNCVNKQRDNYNYDKLKISINQVLGDGGWPLISNEWSESKSFDMNAKIKILINMNKLAIKGRILNFITRSVHQRPSMVRDKNMIGIIGSIGDLMFESFQDEKWTEYENMMNLSLKEVYGIELKGNDIKEMMEFEKNLSSIFLLDQSPTTSESVISMSLKYPKIDWIAVMKELGIDSTKIDLESEADQVFLLNNPTAFNNSLNLMETTNERLLKNFLGWRYFLFLSPFTSLTLRSLIFRFDNLTYQVDEQVDVPEQCVTYASSFMPFAVGKLFMEYYLRDETDRSRDELEHQVTKMINELKGSFYAMIDSNEWMDYETKRKAFKKLNEMKLELFFPSFLAEDKKLDDYYDGLVFKDNDFMSNLMEMYYWLSDRSFKEFRIPQKLNSWDQRSPIEVNAFYSISFNTINVPIGAIAGPFYDQEQPRVLNYGSLGMVLGHEITHGFDSLGRRYDYDGQETEWWTDVAKSSFENRTSCFIGQFKRFEIGGISIQGEQVLDETIADAGGVAEAFKAFQISEVKYGSSQYPDIEVRGKKLTRDQIFFIAFAQTFCQNTRKSYAANQLSSSHPPNKFRVIGSLQDSNDFARVFNCPNGSYMNPRQKCSIW